MRLPEEEKEGGSEEEYLVFWITVKIRDQVYKGVLDRRATLSTVARRFLRKAKIRKTQNRGHNGGG